jgi:hypothetical protein
MRSRARHLAQLAFLILTGLSAAFPFSLAEAAPRGRAACADVMAGFADVAVPRKVALSAEERRSAKKIEQLFENDLFTRYLALDDLKSALEDAPELFSKDPNSAVRASVILLLNGDSRSLKFLEQAAESTLDFSRATLSESEISSIANALLEYTIRNVGFLGLELRLPWLSAEKVLEHERQRAALAFRTVAALAGSARGPERAKLREFVDFDRIESAGRWSVGVPMRPLLEGMTKIAPYGPEEVQVWRRSFRRVAGSKEPPLAIAHRTLEGKIRITSSDPFEGSKIGTVGYERIFTSAEFQKLARGAGQEGLVFQTADGKSGLKLSKKLLDRLAGTKVAEATAPAYESWAKDGKIRGIIWPDYGFEPADAKETMNEYLSFYRGQGFRFRKETVSNFPKWLKQKISSGEADYLVREAHIPLSMALVEKGTLMVGTSADGAHEVMLLFPDKMNGNEGAVMSLLDLDAALKSRAKKDSGNELLYFDTKCNAFSTACTLPQKIESANLRVIAADGVATTMVDRPSSPIRAMLEGLLNQEDYAAIGKRLQKARKRTEGNEDNYLLPGTPKYEQWFSRETELVGGSAEWVDLK